ncbi:hypothetical protein DRJ25_05250 [Candidatus Woesearchaeota archaeon]|nr:MAG: hypothetical protein DRJ25_05250 [Candidatus Woesearchaeota archaeon]
MKMKSKWVEMPIFEMLKKAIRFDKAESRIDYFGYLGQNSNEAEYFEEMNRYRENNIYDSMKADANGFLKGRAVITTTGVFPYVKEDGSIQWELRSPEEVFHPDSLDTLRMAVVTNDHPDALVTPESAKAVMVGSLGEEIIVDQFKGRVASPITVSVKEAIDDVQDGKRALSAGYSCDVVMESGNYNGVPYDARQVKIRYNHVAIVDRGRAGDAAVMRVDAYQAPPGTVKPVVKDTAGVATPVNINKGENMPENFKIVRIDNVEYQAEAPVIAHYSKIDEALKKSNEELAAVTVKADKATADLSTREGERDALQAKLDAAEDKLKNAINVDQLEDLFAERNKLDAAVSKAGIEDTEKMDVMAKKKAVIAKAFPKVSLEEKDDAYVNAMFDAAVTNLDEADSTLEDNLTAGADHNDSETTVVAGEVKTDDENWLQLVKASKKGA